MNRTPTAVFMAAMIVVNLGAGCESGVLVEGLPPPESNRQRIVGGQAFSGLPAVGALVSYGSIFCTGTLIGPRKVLTAGHCVESTYASNIQFMIGTSPSDVQALLQATSAEAHPNFGYNGISNDIGVVTLSQDAPVEYMGVLNLMDSSWVGTDLLHVGFGSTSAYGGAGQKRAVWMPITSVGSTTFSYGNSSQNTCSGDSGGPAFYEDANGQFLVAGVTSYGDQYCTQYGVDTRVDKYLSFLNVSGSGGTGGSTPPSQDNCQGETYEGRCDGETVIWCENNQVMTTDCAASGKVCMYDSQLEYYGCGEPGTPSQPGTPSDPCQGETYEGRCDGDTVIWCENEQIKNIQCDTSSGMTCGLDTAKDIYNCIEQEILDLSELLKNYVVKVWLHPAFKI